MDSKEHAGPGRTHRTLESQESHEQSCEPGGGALVGGFGGNWGGDLAQVITLKHSAPDSWTPMAGSRGGQWAEARWLDGSGPRKLGRNISWGLRHLF